MWKTGVYALGRAGDFGAGWRFDLLDVNLHTTASKRSDSEYCSGSTPSFHAGDLVYLTIAGQEHAFYFDPDPQMGSTGVNPFSQVWYPHFKPVNGETGQLTLGTGSDGLVSKMALSRTQTGEFYYVGGSTIMSGFNPASSDFGGVYIYQTADGTKYTIDASTGKLQMIQSKQGATATLANSVITGPSNQTIVITRNGNSLITQIDVKTAGGTTVNTVKYANDSKGRLLEVTYADDSTAGYLYGNSAFPNHITGLTKGTTADTHSLRTLTVKYDAQGRMQTLLDMYDKPTTIGGGTMSGNTSQSVTDSTGTSAEVIQDDHGNPIRTITQVRDDQGKLTGYQVNVAQYEYSYTGLVMSAAEPDVLGGRRRWGGVALQHRADVGQ